jgi:sarcosine oxidase subunit alpha
MARRLAPLRDSVAFELDGETIEAERGEPIAFALLAADKLALSRSPKLHRPHGPSCLRGGCDGCLARVDGEPNVMTCLVPCRGGERVETQNVLGSRKVDLLQVTDWFFPRGIDHHHFMAGIPAASFVVQKVARHVAGLGRLPDQARPEGSARREEVDAFVVGAGPAGLTVARRLMENAAPGFRLAIADDGVSPGGSLRARGEPIPDLSRLHLYSGRTAAGIYEQEVLVVGDDEAIIVRPRALVLATGAHDGTVAFPGNDLPGVMSARAGALLAQHGIAIGDRVALFGGGVYSDAFLHRMERHVEVFVVPPGATIAAQGRGRITSITVTERASSAPGSRRPRNKSQHTVDALLVEARGASSFELAEQAGASVRFDPGQGCYLPSLDANGRAAPGVWCAGELACTGTSLAAIAKQAEAVADDVRAFL